MLNALGGRRMHFAARPWQFALLAIAVAAFPLHSQILNRNLVVNPGAEDGVAAQATSDPQVASIPGWTTTGGFSVGVYGGPGFLSPSDYGPVTCGAKFFYGGPGTLRATAVQTIDLSGAAAEIDAGRARFSLSGYLGFLLGIVDEINTLGIKADFQDETGASLLQSTAGGILADDVNIPEGILLRTAQGFLPPGVRKAVVTIDLSSGTGAYNSWAADNVSLVLTTDPMLAVNLLANGNGETEPGTDSGLPVPGWNAHTNMVVWKWGDDKMPAASDPGPTDRGKYFFTCFTNKSECRAYQTIDIGAAKKLIDGGRMSFDLSGWLGADAGTPDDASLNVSFFDASGNLVSGGSVDIPPVTQQDRNDQRGMWQRSASGVVPTGARLAQVTLTFHRLRQDPEDNAAYADSISFVLDAMQITTIVNAASSQNGPAVGGEFVSIYGSGLGPATGVISGSLEKGLAGVKVTFNGIEAFLTYASATQINAIVPYGVSDKADAIVQYNTKTSDAFPLTTAKSAPGIFTKQYGAGPAWAVNNDAQFNSSTTPVARGGWIEFWATGQGAVDPGGQDGETVSGWKTLKLPVKVAIGGVDAQVLWSGLIYTGEIQVNVVVPASAPTGDVELIVTIDNVASRKGVTVSVK